MQRLLLDTCTLIFLNQKARMAAAAVEAMRAVSAGGGTTYISPISAWEVGMLTSYGRLQMLITPERWFAGLFDVPGVQARRHVVGCADRVIVLAGQAAERSDRPHHRRDCARARRHP